MPGMMDTVLNLGLNDETVAAWRGAAADARFAYDSYRRFIQMYGNVVLNIDHHLFEEILELHKEDRGISLDTEMTADDWKTIVTEYKAKVDEELGKPFPQNPADQLWGAVGAVFGSWMNQRAITYRRLHQIPEDWGTAVNVQAMVFGNMGQDCATGVAFTRNPSTGENVFYGEYLVNAQGGTWLPASAHRSRSPSPASRRRNRPCRRWKSPCRACQAARRSPQAPGKTFPRHAGHRITVQQNKLYMLQTRGGKRTASAALRIAVEMVKEGLIDKKLAVQRVDPASLEQLLHPRSIPRRRARCWRAACRPRRARPRARSRSMPTRPRTAPPRARR